MRIKALCTREPGAYGGESIEETPKLTLPFRDPADPGYFRVGVGIPDASRNESYTQVVRHSEVALNQNVKKLIQRLGEAIHETVAESEDIAVVVKNIREQGFDVLLMLEATIGLNEVEAETEAEIEDAGSDGFTNSDLHFLKSLRITVDEGEPSSSAPDEEG